MRNHNQFNLLGCRVLWEGDHLSSRTEPTGKVSAWESGPGGWKMDLLVSVSVNNSRESFGLKNCIMAFSKSRQSSVQFSA